MPASNVSAFFKFDRQFGVPLDSSFVFQTTNARNNYLTDSATSGVAYTGMIVADLETNKVYMLNSSRAWQEVGITVNETFGANNSGILFKTGNNTFNVGGLNSGANINITNPSGISANPTIALNSGLSGISSISGVNNFRIAANSGIVIDAGSGVVNVDDLKIDGKLTVGNSIDILLAAEIISNHSVTYSGNPTIYKGNVYYQNTPYVGPTGGVLGTTLFPVSLSGHKHPYTDINNFCSGVSDCVNTSIVGSSGIQLIYNSGTNSLRLALSGESLAQHSITQNGFIARTLVGDDDISYIGRTLQPGANINILNGAGGDDPIISLSDSITGLSSLGANNATVSNNLTIGGNLTVNGTSIIANIDTVTIEDPILTLGLTSGNIVTNNSFDRGLALIRGTGLTAFMGWDTNATQFVMLSSGVATNNSGNYDAGTYGNLQINNLIANSGNFTTNIVAGGFVRSGGSSNQFLKADGSVDSTGYTTNLGTVTSVGGTGSVAGLTLTGTVTTNGNLTLGGTLSTPVSTINDSTTVGQNLVKLTNPSGIRFLRINADNTVHALSDSDFRTAIGAGTSSTVGTVTSVTAGSGMNFTSITSSGPVTLGTPSSITLNSTNSTTLNSHTHAFSPGGNTSQYLRGDGTLASFPSINDATLTLNVSGIGLSGSQTFTANQSTSGTFTVTSNATSANILSTIVARDASGNFIAGNITASGFIGSGSSLTNLNATNISTGTIGVSYLPTSIPISNLASSGITFGTVFSSLGSTVSTFTGLTAISGTSIASPTLLVNCSIDGGTP